MSDTTAEWLEDPIVGLVVRDLTPALNAAFEESGGFSPSPDLPIPLTASGQTVVAWEYRGTERLNALARAQFVAERRQVIVRGITVVSNADTRPLFHRYIDWAGVYDQLGLVPGRPSRGAVVEAAIGRDGDALILVSHDQ